MVIAEIPIFLLDSFFVWRTITSGSFQETDRRDHMVLRLAALFGLIGVLLVGLGGFGSEAEAATCQGHAYCDQCGPCCGSSGCQWTPTCGAGGPTVTCVDGNCCNCAVCCTYANGTMSCNCARCIPSQTCCQGTAPQGSTPRARAEPAVHSPYRVGFTARAVDDSLAISSLQITEDRAGKSSVVSFELRNDSAVPIVSFVLSWKLSES